LSIVWNSFFLLSNEHLPIHIHVQNASGKAKFQVLPNVKLVRNKGLKSSEIKLAESIIDENKNLIINLWEAFHGNMD
jgi:hypothetical protein